MSSEARTARLPPWLGLPLIVVGLVFLIWLKPDLGADDRARTKAQQEALIFAMAATAAPPPAQGNRLADDPKMALLGQALFFDKALSRHGQVSCATCHQPDKNFSDGRRVGVGVGVGDRNTPSLLGAQFNHWWFWDGRRDSQWSQALAPLESAAEHHFDRLAVMRRVVQAHAQRYHDAIEPLPDDSSLEEWPDHATPVGDDAERAAWNDLTDAQRSAVNRVFANVGKALEAYQRLLLPGAAPIDAYAAARQAGDLRGGGHLSPSAVRGLNLFIGRAKCVLCHSGPFFTDHSFHNIGLPSALALGGCKGESCGPDSGRTHGARNVLAHEMRCGSEHSDAKDCRRLRHLNPGFDDFIGAFKTPSLRQVAETAPYMHSGEFGSLDDVLAFYNELPGTVTMGHRELFLTPLRFKPSELADLKAFLGTLSGSGPPVALRRPLEPK